MDAMNEIIEGTPDEIRRPEQETEQVDLVEQAEQVEPVEQAEQAESVEQADTQPEAEAAGSSEPVAESAEDVEAAA